MIFIRCYVIVMYNYCIMFIYIVFIAEYQSKLELIRSNWHIMLDATYDVIEKCDFIWVIHFCFVYFVNCVIAIKHITPN